MIVGLSGYARAGKDTVAEILVGEGFTRIAFADLMKEALQTLDPIVGKSRLNQYIETYGWEETKVSIPEVRQLLQRFGTDVGRGFFGEDFWINQLYSKHDITGGGDWVISDVRFLNEAERLRNDGGQIWQVMRPGVGPVNTHVSDSGLNSFRYDYVLNNDNDLEKLKLITLAALKANRES